MKRVYESPEMEIVQFVAKENVAADGDAPTNGDNWKSAPWPDPEE